MHSEAHTSAFLLAPVAIQAAENPHGTLRPFNLSLDAACPAPFEWRLTVSGQSAPRF